MNDLRGRVVATNAIGAQSAVYRVLAYHGMTLDDVRLETIAFPDQLVALSNGAIDAATAIEPFVTLGQERNVLVPLFDIGQALPGYPGRCCSTATNSPASSPTPASAS